MSDEFTTTIQLPVKARLVLLAEDGREVPVTPEILRDFNYVPAYAVYDQFKAALCRVLAIEDMDDAPEWAQVIRYMVECPLFYNHDFDYSAHPEDPEDDDTKSNERMISVLRSITVQENSPA